MTRRTRRHTQLEFVLQMLLLCVFVVLPASAADRKPARSDLEGTWFVIVHYKNVATANPDATRWLDRVWTFEMRGSRLHWVEFPIVVLNDSNGRFEPIPGNPRSRVLEGWLPNEGQLAEIKAGPRVNTRGSKSKSLKGSDMKNWKSISRSSAQSATMVSYTENWSIEGRGKNRIFRMQQVLGNALMEKAEGETLYTVTEQIGKDEFRGSYSRDDNQTGTFRIIRTESTRALLTAEDDRTPNQRFNDRMRDEFRRGSRGEQ